jgi:hypothetical protein
MGDGVLALALILGVHPTESLLTGMREHKKQHIAHTDAVGVAG